MYGDPPEQFKRKTNDDRWNGDGEVAFARHTDPMQPLLYWVPDYVHMRIDTNASTADQRAKNRGRPFCIADCGKP
jgi:hypothetical protein